MNVYENNQDLINGSPISSVTEYKKSSRWKEYKLGHTLTHCKVCYQRKNKIYEIHNEPLLPEHLKCLCYLQFMKSVSVGTATCLGEFGADYYLKNFGELPQYYISKQQAEVLGWEAWKGNLNEVIPGKMIGGDVFFNREQKLPSSPGRIWYECDIDYSGGFRNNYRLIYSNDGLMFKTDSHYTSFIAVE